MINLVYLYVRDKMIKPQQKDRYLLIPMSFDLYITIYDECLIICALTVPVICYNLLSVKIFAFTFFS